MRNKYTVTFRRDDDEKSASFLLLGTFLLGPIYLLFFQMWAPAIIFLLISLVIWLLGLMVAPHLIIAGIALPFLAENLARKWYLSHGWKEVLDGSTKQAANAGNPKEKISALERAQIALLEAQTEAIKKGSRTPVPSSKAVVATDDSVPTYRL